ncbi:cbb3-type cytochrome c oxidase N-terminal domain-containing protein [Winogradskyella bathintestinalis]|uniref:Cbb3-type cytochrome c oxidase N-terminal domain-containing protein n=1 Tax=Winogradskyella bathintestinalis TaxID=3035208 RepID=A0ABT7ZTD6_9FLAO|nr:cbb3-type cytochrome c oxidase N-terminal domain-containing protein [Winogradskyella bathintestinalis]MDN3492261.1 cbb3-type cytochrome c oxidase N-terminal domain-containing protein [Winogradskyella bathintestinalis]
MRNLIPSWLRIPFVFFIIVGLIEFFVDSGDRPAFIKEPLILLFLLLVLLVIIAIEAMVGSLNNILYQSLDEEGKKRYDLKASGTPKFVRWVKRTYQKMLGSKPIQEEHEIILDHNYDGIKELDNDLPPWWLYGFYASIIFAVIYMFKYEVFNGDNQYDELDTEYAEAKVAIEEYKKTAKNLVDVNTVEVLVDASDLNAGKIIYEANCAICHVADGGGQIGPNLTDPNWILGGGIKNVFNTISEGGRAGKGMVPWKQNLKPLEIAQVASYVLQFEGTIAAKPKDAEGDIWIDAALKDVETGEKVHDIDVEVKSIIPDSLETSVDF